MSQARIEARTKSLVPHGAACLYNYRHSFSHLGSDGTGKGNITNSPDGVVWGVLYGITHEQAELLHSYEPGYHIVEIEVRLASSDVAWSAYTYVSKQCSHGLSPTKDYLAHYIQGMSENQFPENYIQDILRQARS